MINGIAFLPELICNSAVSVDTIILLENLCNICLLSCVFICILLLQIIVVGAPGNAG